MVDANRHNTLTRVINSCIQPEIHLHRRLAHAELVGAEFGYDIGKALRKVGVVAVGRFEIRLELLADLGRTSEICRTDNDALSILWDVGLVPVLVECLEEKIPFAVRFALGWIAIVADQLLARLDADELRLVAALVFRALEKPKLVDT